MNPIATNMKIDSDTFVCMICLAAFIGYTLGLRNMVNTTVKTQQCHKVTQTNLSDLADILTSSHLMINNLQKSTIMQVQSPMLILDNVHDDVVSKAEEDKVDSIETSASSENHTDNNNKTLSPIILNNSEEEYEVILGNVKKNDTTKGIKPQYYFGWFDSMF
jgi:hypothetical protein